MKRILSLSAALLFLLSFANIQAKVGESKVDNTEKLVGNLIQSHLSRYHYTGKTLDDSLSKNAFQEYIKKLDYGKQFFLQKDVDKLSKYQYKMDNELVSGKHELLVVSMDLHQKRIKELNDYRKSIFKKEFSFKDKEYLELDPEKREFPETEKELKDYWRRVYKQSVLSQYISLMEAQDDLKKELAEAKKEGSKKDSDKVAKAAKKDKKKKKKEEKILSDAELIKKAHKKVNEKYEKVFARLMKDERADYMEKFFNAVTSVYDPHTVYFPPKRKEDFDIDISGQLEGIGAVLQEDGAYIKVVRIVPGGAAWRQKDLEVDDIILSAAEGDEEPVDLVNMRVDDAVRYIRGKKGTIVKLTVKKVDGTRKVIPIERDVVQIEASYAKASVLKHKELNIRVGYIHVPKFYRDFKDSSRSCTADVLMELKRLKKLDIQGVILDLRNNGGGALKDAEEMSGLFIKEGPIVQIKGQGEIDVLKDTNTNITYDGPLIVMVNRFSASASEILAGAMQDYKRAVIVGGEHTHGKGTVQAILDFNSTPLMNFLNKDLGGLKITVQKFYRITGASTQFKGVTPDIILPDPMAYADNREQDLDYAIPWDQVDAQEYKEWDKFSYGLPLLKKRSEKRVSKSERFNRIKESIEYLTKKKDETKVSLNLKEVLAEDEKNKKVTDRLKEKEESKDLVVLDFEKSLMAHEKINPGEEVRWKEDFEQRKKDWVKSLVEDPMIEETMFIMDDMIRQVQGKKLSMVK
ncbi:MAG: tail-specific protease [Halobacteriovoraceae bacterium]|nr:tail-specific protease [Halobacteriovoraceae bacterium]MBC97862.1 tail-specific protease [Halobacteriovoraceae bacterium]|tara:strand:+ start:52762 stop:54999 length:2238 start_codon:yes stop_codon:yes gene_type:complete